MEMTEEERATLLIAKNRALDAQDNKEYREANYDLLYDECGGDYLGSLIMDIGETLLAALSVYIIKNVNELCD